MCFPAITIVSLESIKTKFAHQKFWTTFIELLEAHSFNNLIYGWYSYNFPFLWLEVFLVRRLPRFFYTTFIISSSFCVSNIILIAHQENTFYGYHKFSEMEILTNIQKLCNGDIERMSLLHLDKFGSYFSVS